MRKYVWLCVLFELRIFEEFPKVNAMLRESLREFLRETIVWMLWLGIQSASRESRYYLAETEATARTTAMFAEFFRIK